MGCRKSFCKFSKYFQKQKILLQKISAVIKIMLLILMLLTVISTLLLPLQSEPLRFLWRSICPQRGLSSRNS